MFHLSTINYLKSNNIKFFKFFNILISLPTTSPHFDNLYCKDTTKIDFINPITKKYSMILITKN